jgi:hypothetical protein
MASSNNSEKRNRSRVGFATVIRLLIEADGKEIILKGSSRDLSLTGIFLSTENKYECGTKCSIIICLTGGIDKIELMMKGTVVRISDNGLGIVFDSMDVDTYSHLKNIVQYNSVDES